MLELVELVKATRQEEQVVHNLMQFYIYEFSKYIPAIKLEANGFFKPFDLENKWSNPDWHAFFIKHGEEYVGFTFVEYDREASVYTMQEFFIMQKYNGKGFGRSAAFQLFERFAGKWIITQIEPNYPAQAFWRRAVHKFTNGTYSERYDHHRRSVQEFDTTTIDH